MSRVPVPVEVQTDYLELFQLSNRRNQPRSRNQQVASVRLVASNLLQDSVHLEEAQAHLVLEALRLDLVPLHSAPGHQRLEDRPLSVELQPPPVPPLTQRSLPAQRLPLARLVSGLHPHLPSGSPASANRPLENQVLARLRLGPLDLAPRQTLLHHLRLDQQLVEEASVRLRPAAQVHLVP